MLESNWKASAVSRASKLFPCGVPHLGESMFSVASYQVWDAFQKLSYPVLLGDMAAWTLWDMAAFNITTWPGCC